MGHYHYHYHYRYRYRYRDFDVVVKALDQKKQETQALAGCFGQLWLKWRASYRVYRQRNCVTADFQIITVMLRLCRTTRPKPER